MHTPKAWAKTEARLSGRRSKSHQQRGMERLQPVYRHLIPLSGESDRARPPLGKPPRQSLQFLKWQTQRKKSSR